MEEKEREEGGRRGTKQVASDSWEWIIDKTVFLFLSSAECRSIRRLNNRMTLENAANHCR